MSEIERRLRQLEAKMERAAEPRTALTIEEVDEVIALWGEMSHEPAESSPLPPNVAAMSDAEAVDEWRRLCRVGVRP